MLNLINAERKKKANKNHRNPSQSDTILHDAT